MLKVSVKTDWFKLLTTCLLKRDVSVFPFHAGAERRRPPARPAVTFLKPTSDDEDSTPSHSGTVAWKKNSSSNSSRSQDCGSRSLENPQQEIERNPGKTVATPPDSTNVAAATSRSLLNNHTSISTRLMQILYFCATVVFSNCSWFKTPCCCLLSKHVGGSTQDLKNRISGVKHRLTFVHSWSCERFYFYNIYWFYIDVVCFRTLVQVFFPCLLSCTRNCETS